MLPYTAEVLWALFDTYNRAIWPAPAIALALAAGIFWAVLKPVRGGDRIAAAFLAAGWLWTGAVFHLGRFADINFAAPAYGAAFLVEAALMLWLGVGRGGLGIRLRDDAASRSGLAIAAASAVLLPLADWGSGAVWSDARIALIAPGATAGLTLGLLVMAERPRAAALAVVPVLWGGVTGFQAYSLGIMQDYFLPAAAIVAVFLIIRRHLGDTTRAPGGRNRTRGKTE